MPSTVAVPGLESERLCGSDAWIAHLPGWVVPGCGSSGALRMWFDCLALRLREVIREQRELFT